jgi:MFS family permease
MTRAAFVCCVFLPFGLGHFMSVLLRMVGGVTAPFMAARYGLDAAQLGVLSGAYFLGFALAQLPVGLALDRYGPRRVQLVLLPLAALGCWGFGQAASIAGLLATRLLLGFALGACFMSAIKAAACWGQAARLASINGWLIAAGGLGGAAATLPVLMLLDLAGWQGLFNCLALLLAGVASLIALAAPRHLARAEMSGWFYSFSPLLQHPGVFRIVGLLVVPHAVYFGVQGLWLGRWLQGAGGLPEAEVAWQLYLCMVGGIFGAIGTGLLAERVERLGAKVADLAAAGVALMIALLLLMACGWRASMPALAVLFCVVGAVTGLEYTLVARSVPRTLAGRATTCLNLLVFSGAFAVQAIAGWLVQRSFQQMFLVLAVALLPGLIFHVAGRRSAASSESASLSTSIDSSSSLIVKGGASST